MSLYLSVQKLDLAAGDTFDVLLNRKDAEAQGIKEDDIVSIAWGENVVNCIAHLTDTEITNGVIGIFTEIWERYEIVNDSEVCVMSPEPTTSVDLIRKKILGKKLTEEEILQIMRDMGSRRIGQIETAFFMGTFFNPGFDEDETLWMTKGMAESGDVLSFKGYKGEKTLVVDKHSIGGVAGKAVTPVLVPIIACFDGLVIPNTSTRAITSPAGTSDILEVVMPVSLSTDQILDVVKKTNACLVWGGALDLAPADDVLINVERVIHLESYQKIMVSIVAKKLSTGITHILMDIPYGRGTKIQNIEDMRTIKREFEKLYEKVGVKCHVLTRECLGPDGRGIGPNLEMIEVLRILERDNKRDIVLEDLALKMAGLLLELCGKAKKGEGYDMAKEKLDNKDAYNKFWDIAKAQGATQVVSEKDIEMGQYKYEVISKMDGVVKLVNNKELMKVSRNLGAPGIKNAGIYMNKYQGETIKKGDVLMTLYTTAQTRLDNTVNSLIQTDIFTLV